MTVPWLGMKWNVFMPIWRHCNNCLNQFCNIINWTIMNNFNEIWTKIKSSSFKKMHLEMSSVRYLEHSRFASGTVCWDPGVSKWCDGSQGLIGNYSPVWHDALSWNLRNQRLTGIRDQYWYSIRKSTSWFVCLLPSNRLFRYVSLRVVVAYLLVFLRKVKKLSVTGRCYNRML